MAENPEYAEYINKCRDVYGQAVSDLKNISGWTQVTESDDVIVSSMQNADSDFKSFKAEVYFNKPPSEVSRYCYDNWPELQKEFQGKEFPTFDVIKKYDENVMTTYAVIHPGAPVSNRLSLHVYIYLPIADTTQAIIGTSVPMPDIPTPPNHVLDDLKMGVSIFEPVAGDENRTHMSAIYKIDPKGNIPAFIFNAFISQRIKFYEKLRDRVNGL